MIKLRTPLVIFSVLVSLTFAARGAEGQLELKISSPSSDTNNWAEFDYATGTATITNGAVVEYGQTVLTSQKASINERTGDIFADGNVRIQKDDQTWTGDHIFYNYKTGQMDANRFRTGKYPVFAAGTGLHRDPTNQSYVATNAVITSDDYEHPFIKIRAKEIKIVPGEYIEARHAAVYAGKAPVFYFPYYRRTLKARQNNFSVVPGYRSRYGPYLLGSYNWFYNEYLDGTIHTDWRQKRGFGTGPDVNLHLGSFGESVMRYYYLHDEDPGLDSNGQPIPTNRQRFYFAYTGNLRTNVEVRSQVAYQSDPLIIRDFFEGEYRKDIQPNTFFELNPYWQNWSLDVLAQPRVNDFFETVERLPDVRLTGFRQQIAETPFYYDSESSVGYFRRLFPETNTSLQRFSAARADTFHQITLPRNFFGWLNFTPRVGGRFTYYSEATGPGATTDEEYRTVFNTGAELSTKASRVWGGVRNDFFDVDGLRHIIEPSMNYVYVPSPSVLPPRLPQFDYEITNSLSLLPIEFPDFNAIDSIDSQNVIRWGLRNRLQTKRDGQIDNLINWGLYADWRLKPRNEQGTFSNIYSELSLRPHRWLTLASYTRFDIQSGNFELAQNSITIQPNNVWSWTGGHFYVREGTLLGPGHNLFRSIFYYRFNENWGARMSHSFEAQDGVLEEQYYTLYRDLRSWTAALTFRVRDNRGQPDDYTVAFSFSLKAAPRYGVGQDTVNASSLVGY